MGYVVLFIVVIVLLYFLFTKLLIPFYGLAVAFLGQLAEKLVQFFQWSLWTTGVGNLVLASVALIVASAVLYAVYRGLARRIAAGAAYDEAMRRKVVDHAIAEYKKEDARALSFATGSKGLALALRITILVAALGATALAAMAHLRRGSLSAPLTLSTLALGTCMTLFMAVSFALESRAACPRELDDFGGEPDSGAAR
jgi:hypothetical protein